MPGVLGASLLVGLGGAVGALTRFAGIALVNHLVERFAGVPGDRFPLGTLAVNVTGCLIVGIIMGWHQHADRAPSETLRQFVLLGFLGSLTTFSTFGAETIRLFQEHRPMLALANMALSLTLALLAVVLGVVVGGWLARSPA